MVDFGSQISGYVKDQAQNFVQKNIDKITRDLSGLGGGIINSLIGSVSQGLSQNLFDIGSAFDTIEAVASRKLDSIVAGGADEFAAGGKCTDRATAADISSMRNPGGGSLKDYLTDVFPESKIQDKYNNSDSYILTHSSDKYYLKLRFYPYERKDLFGPATNTMKYEIILPLPLDLFDVQRSEFETANLKTLGSLMNNTKGGQVGEGTTLAIAGNVTKNIMGKIGNKLNNSAGDPAGLVGIDGESITNAVEQYLGVAPNPNPSVMFKGPSLREFNFSWMFNPRNSEESRRVKETIRKMKASALPMTEFGSDTGLLRYPHVVMLNFYPWDSGSDVSNHYGWTNESFIRIKRCVISNINADYAPSGAPSFFEGTNDPTFIRLSLSLREIEFFVSSDWGGGEGTGEVKNRVDEAIDTISNYSQSIIDSALDSITGGN